MGTELTRFPTERSKARSLSAMTSNAEMTPGRALSIHTETRKRSRVGQRDAEAMAFLVRSVIHDVNNLLTVVLGDCELLASELKDERVRALVEGVKKAGEWAASLTAALLAKDARRVPGPQLLELNDLLANMEPALRSLLGDNITLSILLEARPSLIRANPSQLGQVVLNLALNARDAMPSGGKLTVKTMHSSVSADDHVPHLSLLPGNYVLLSVSDSGQGMDAGTQARIFEPSFTTKKAGKGIGLAAAREIVTRAGGFIGVESQPGAGTTFSIYLPQARTSERPRAMEAGAVTRRPARILLVDDEPLLREMVRRTLESCGHTVLTASNALEAARLIGEESEPIDLLLTDLAMPEIGGRELAARLKRLRPRMKVLFMSGYGAEDSAQDGQTGFLPKPFRPGTLLKKVQEMLASDPGQSSYEAAEVKRASLERLPQAQARQGKARVTALDRRREPGGGRRSIAQLPATLRAST